MIRIVILAFAGLSFSGAAITDKNPASFGDEEIAVAKFWEDMGPTLRDEGVEAYAIRYHEDFRHWDIGASGAVATKESAVNYWSKFHEDGNRITCTYVKPLSVEIEGDVAFAQLIYEQTITHADERVATTHWRIAGVFKEYGDSWQVLQTNMVDITPKPDKGEDGVAAATEAERYCPA